MDGYRHPRLAKNAFYVALDVVLSGQAAYAASGSRVGPRYPLMAEENIVLFGYNAEAGWIDAAETQVLAQCQMMTYPLAQIRGTVKESAKEALTQLESKADSILIYFDVGEPGCRCQPVLSFDYERLPESSETMVKIASFRILIRRL